MSDGSLASPVAPARAIPGSCSCGAVRFTVTPPSRFVVHCHCVNCRRSHGAGCVTWAGFPLAQRELQADRELASFDTDTGARRSFCRRCGSPLFYVSPRWPGEVHVAVAALDGELDRAPAAHAFADRAPAWCPISDDLPRLGGPTGVEPLSAPSELPGPPTSQETHT